MHGTLRVKICMMTVVIKNIWTNLCSSKNQQGNAFDHFQQIAGELFECVWPFCGVGA